MKDRCRSCSMVFESAYDAITVLSEDGVIVEANARTSDMLGYTRDELVGRPIGEFAAPGKASDNVASFRATVSEGAGRAAPIPIRHADGRIVHIEWANRRVMIDERPLVVCVGRDVTETVEAIDRLAKSERDFRRILESLPDVVWSTDGDLNVTYMSPNVVHVTGFAASEILGTDKTFWHSRTHPDDAERLAAAMQSLATQMGSAEITYRWQRKDGQWIWVRDRSSVVRNADGSIRSIDGVMSDVTAQRKLEEQLRHSQKLEAVARLTGGVAHDFNNILAVIITNAGFLRADLVPGDPLRESVDEIRTAAERGAVLTRQLLAFSRKQVLQPAVFDLNGVVASMEKMTRRLIGADIQLTTKYGATGSVRADVGQIEQVVMNLVVNARDAMPTGGKLSLEVEDVETFTNEEVPPGTWVRLSVRDTGVGMTPETLRRVFEPFFTTKEKGKGTGLGLSTSIGIVEQSGGHLRVTSEVGAGSTFRVYLPRTAETLEEPRQTAAIPAVPRGSERVLVVEDDDGLRRALTRMLAQLGYHVHPARNAEEAYAAARVGLPIDLLVSDVVMPGPSGPAVATQIRATSPATKVLYMSGYVDQAKVDGTPILQKPFEGEVLGRMVRQILDA